MGGAAARGAVGIGDDLDAELEQPLVDLLESFGAAVASSERTVWISSYRR